MWATPEEVLSDGEIEKEFILQKGFNISYNEKMLFGIKAVKWARDYILNNYNLTKK